MTIDLDHVVESTCGTTGTVASDEADLEEMLLSLRESYEDTSRLYPKVQEEEAKITWDYSLVEKKPSYGEALDAISKDRVGYSKSALEQKVVKIVYNKLESWVVIKLETDND